MKKVFFIFLLSAFPFIALSQENQFIQKDRERLIRIETMLREFMKSVDKRFEGMDKRFEGIDKRFEGMDKRLEEFRIYVDRRFEGMDRRFEGIDKRFEGMDKRLEEFRIYMDKRFEEMMTFLWILSGIFTGIVGITIAFAIWDRRTMTKPFEEKIKENEKKTETIIRVFKEMAQTDSKLKAILKKFGIL